MRTSLIAATALAALLMGACASPAPPPQRAVANLPLLQGWYEGKVVFYITTDVSDAGVAQEKGANFAPRLAYALPAAGTQSAVFASAPNPVGPLSRDVA